MIVCGSGSTKFDDFIGSGLNSIISFEKKTLLVELCFSLHIIPLGLDPNECGSDRIRIHITVSKKSTNIYPVTAGEPEYTPAVLSSATHTTLEYSVQPDRGDQPADQQTNQGRTVTGAIPALPGSCLNEEFLKTAYPEKKSINNPQTESDFNADSDSDSGKKS